MNVEAVVIIYLIRKQRFVLLQLHVVPGIELLGILVHRFKKFVHLSNLAQMRVVVRSTKLHNDMFFEPVVQHFEPGLCHVILKQVIIHIHAAHFTVRLAILAPQ